MPSWRSFDFVWIRRICAKWFATHWRHHQGGTLGRRHTLEMKTSWGFGDFNSIRKYTTYARLLFWDCHQALKCLQLSAGGEWEVRDGMQAGEKTESYSTHPFAFSSTGILSSLVLVANRPTRSLHLYCKSAHQSRHWLSVMQSSYLYKF